MIDRQDLTVGKEQTPPSGKIRALSGHCKSASDDSAEKVSYCRADLGTVGFQWTMPMLLPLFSCKQSVDRKTASASQHQREQPGDVENH